MDTNIKELEETAELLKVLSHPIRLCIMKGLMDDGNSNVTFIQNCLGMPQSTISTHLQKLRAAGIVQAKRKGLEVTYSVTNDKVKEIIQILFTNKENL